MVNYASPDSELNYGGDDEYIAGLAESLKHQQISLEDIPPELHGAIALYFAGQQGGNPDPNFINVPAGL